MLDRGEVEYGGGGVDSVGVGLQVCAGKHGISIVAPSATHTTGL